MTLKLYPDFRIGGRPKFILASEPPELMFIPDEIRKCVVYIGYRLSNGEFSPQGTAFLVARPIEDTEYSFSYLVTAAHLIQGIGSKESFDGKILLRANFADGNAYTIETDYTNWLFHPDESEVDVAILPHQKLEADTMSIPFEMIYAKTYTPIITFKLVERYS